MDIIEAIHSRRSVRAYRADPVPQEVLREILEIARRAPSAINSQPWEITVVTGQALENIKQGNIEMLNSGKTPNPETTHLPFEGKYKQRQLELTIDLYHLLGITREDKAKRAEWRELGFHYYGAPAAFILYLDKWLNESTFSFLDMGAIIQTICLAALNYGLGTCILQQGVMFPEVVRRFAHIPESKRLIVSIAIGYPDWDFPANKLETKRDPIDSIVTWCDA